MLFGKRLNISRQLFCRQVAERIFDPERWLGTGALLRFGSRHIHGREIGAEVDIFRRSSATFGMIDLVLSILVDAGDDSSAQRSSMPPFIVK